MSALVEQKEPDDNSLKAKEVNRNLQLSCC